MRQNLDTRKKLGDYLFSSKKFGIVVVTSPMTKSIKSLKLN